MGRAVFKQISSSASGAIDYMLRALTTRGDRYFRIQTDLDKNHLKWMMQVILIFSAWKWQRNVQLENIIVNLVKLQI